MKYFFDNESYKNDDGHQDNSHDNKFHDFDFSFKHHHNGNSFGQLSDASLFHLLSLYLSADFKA